MPVTRQREQEGFRHIMENVLNVTNETRQALAQLNIETIPDLMDKSYDTINSLEYYPKIKDSNENDVQCTHTNQENGSTRICPITSDLH